MKPNLKIGIIGDHNPDLSHHQATEGALDHAADSLAVSLTISWISTESLAVGDPEAILEPFDGLWCAPGSPYNSTDGALQAIQFARERGWPFVGT